MIFVTFFIKQIMYTVNLKFPYRPRCSQRVTDKEQAKPRRRCKRGSGRQPRPNTHRTQGRSQTKSAITSTYTHLLVLTSHFQHNLFDKDYSSNYITLVQNTQFFLWTLHLLHNHNPMDKVMLYFVFLDSILFVHHWELSFLFHIHTNELLIHYLNSSI